MTAQNKQILLDAIFEIIKKGNSVEVKREKDNIVLVEIKRKVKSKTPLE